MTYKVAKQINNNLKENWRYDGLIQERLGRL